MRENINEARQDISQTASLSFFVYNLLWDMTAIYFAICMLKNTIKQRHDAGKFKISVVPNNYARRLQEIIYCIYHMHYFCSEGKISGSSE